MLLGWHILLIPAVENTFLLKYINLRVPRSHNNRTFNKVKEILQILLYFGSNNDILGP